MKSFVALLCLVLCVLCAAPVFAAPVVRRTVVRGPLGFRRTVVREVVAPQALIVRPHAQAIIAHPQPQAIIVPQQSVYGAQPLILVR
jgi:hypothetical protein